MNSKSATLITQRYPGETVGIISYGQGGIKDMVLTATEIKKTYNGLVDTINQAATEGGELHALKEIKAAVDTLEKV